MQQESKYCCNVLGSGEWGQWESGCNEEGKLEGGVVKATATG